MNVAFRGLFQVKGPSRFRRESRPVVNFFFVDRPVGHRGIPVLPSSHVSKVRRNTTILRGRERIHTTGTSIRFHYLLLHVLSVRGGLSFDGVPSTKGGVLSNASGHDFP